MRTRAGSITRVKRSRGRPRKVVKKTRRDESISEYPRCDPTKRCGLSRRVNRSYSHNLLIRRGNTGGDPGSSRGSIGSSSDFGAEKLSIGNDDGNESTKCINVIKSKKDLIDNLINEQYMFTLENEGEQNPIDVNNNEENNVFKMTLSQLSMMKEKCNTLMKDMVPDLPTESVTTEEVLIDLVVPGNRFDGEDKEKNYVSTAELFNSSKTTEIPSTFDGFTLTMDTQSGISTLSGHTTDVQIVLAPINEDVDDNQLQQLTIDALTKSKEDNSGSKYCPGSDSESRDDTNLPVKQTGNTKVLLETSGLFIQTRLGSSGDAISSESESNAIAYREKFMDDESDQNGQQELPATTHKQQSGEQIMTSIRGPGTGRARIISSNLLRSHLAQSSNSDSDDGVYYNNQLIDDHSDEDDRQLKDNSGVDNIGLDPANNYQQKSRGCGRQVLGGKARGARRSLGLRGVNRGRLNIVRVGGNVSRYGIGGGLRGIGHLPRVRINMTSMRPYLQGQSLNFGRQEGVKQEELEIIDLTEEPTIDRLQSYGISVSRVIVEEKEVKLPDYMNLKVPPSITVTQATPRPGCSSWQSRQYD